MARAEVRKIRGRLASAEAGLDQACPLAGRWEAMLKTVLDRMGGASLRMSCESEADEQRQKRRKI
jgi:hypothetical protein